MLLMNSIIIDFLVNINTNIAQDKAND